MPVEETKKFDVEKEAQLKGRMINSLIQKLQEYRGRPIAELKAFLDGFTLVKARGFITEILQRELDQYKSQKKNATEAETSLTADKIDIDLFLK